MNEEPYNQPPVGLALRVELVFERIITADEVDQMVADGIDIGNADEVAEWLDDPGELHSEWTELIVRVAP